MVENKNKSTRLQKKLTELLEVKLFCRGKLKQNNNVIPHIFLDTSTISECDERRIYEVIAERLSDKNNNILYEYEVSDRPVNRQIRKIVYELSEKVRYKATYEGMIALKITREFVRRGVESELLIQFLKDQGWYLIVSAREGVKEIFDWMSTKIFVDEITTVSLDDLSYISPVDSLKTYEINLNMRLANELDKYMVDIRNKPNYSCKCEQIILNQLAYNALKLAMGTQRGMPRKISGVGALTEGVNDRVMEEENKRRIGFQIEYETKGER